MKKVLVLGASPNPHRYAHTAVERLLDAGFEVLPVGIRQGLIRETPILLGQPELKNIHTVTIYLNPSHQKEHIDYIFALHPKRIIFNPGTENPAFIQLAREKGIETVFACTLVMLSLDSF